MTSEVFLEDLFCESSCKVLPGLYVLRTLDGDSVENFKFFKKVKNIETVAFFFGDGIAGQVENDEFVETTEILDLFGVCNFVVANVKFHKTSKFREVFKGVNGIVFEGQLKKIVESGDVLYFGDFVFSKFHFFEID